MSAGRVFALVLAVTIVLLVGWSVFEGVGNQAVTPPLRHVRVQAYVYSSLLVFFERLVTIVVFTALLSFSLIIRPVSLGSQGSRIIAAIRPVMIIIVVLGVANGLWFGLLAPRVELRVQQIAHQSRTARDALTRAEEALERRDFAGAEEHLLLHQAIVGETERVRDLLRLAEAGLLGEDQLQRSRRAVSETEDRRWLTEVSGMSVSDLLTQARQFLADDDYFSAHHYATLAVEQSRTPRQDARNIQAEALNAIERGALAQDEEEARRLYRDKIEAYEALQRGATIPEQALEAYYRFQDLENRIPNDPDVQRFAPEARRLLSRITFFLEDARSNQALPGRANLVFINNRTADGVEVIAVNRLVRVMAGDFLYDIEVMRTSTAHADGVEMHLHAPYGKIIGDRLVLRAISQDGDHRDGDANVTGPRFLEGSSRDINGALLLHHSADEIARFAGSRDALMTLTLSDLFQLSPLLERLGRSPRIAREELVRRLFRIGGFFVAAIAAIGIGWRYRSRYVARPPVVFLLLVPLVLWLVWWIIGFLRFLLSAIAGTLVSFGSLPLVLMVTAGGIVLAVIVAVYSVVRQTVEL